MDARIRFVLRFIEERGGTLQITPSQIGSLVGLGDARVLRLFRTEVGTTLRRHLLAVRMARAAELLRNGNLPIKRIAFDGGYSLVSNFHRDFKLVYGISPKRMRLLRLSGVEAAAPDRTDQSRGVPSGGRAKAAAGGV